MKIKRKIVTSTNKTSGYRIGNLFNSLNYLVVYVRFKGEDIGKTQLFYFSQDFNKLSESETFSDVDGVPQPIFEKDGFHYWYKESLKLLNQNEDREIIQFPKSDDFVSKTLIGFKYIQVKAPLQNGKFDYSLLDFSEKKIIWSKEFDERIDFHFLKEYKNSLVYNFLRHNKTEIQCFDFMKGDLVWSVDVTDWFPFQFDKKTVYKNQVRQLVIYQNLVLVNMHGHVVAFEIETGKEIWRRHLEQQHLIDQYYFILDETKGLLWVITATHKHRKGVLKSINAQTGEVLWTASQSWENDHPQPDYGDRWWWHFSMNKNFIFLTFESGFMGVMDKKTGAIVEWFKFTKRNGAVNHGHKLLNKTLYQPTDFEFLAIDVSEYFLDGDTMEVNSRDD